VGMNGESGDDRGRKRLTPGMGMGKPLGCGVSPIFIFVIIGALVLYWVFGMIFGGRQPPQVSYSSFREQLRDGNVAEITVQGSTVRGQYRKPVTVAVGDEKTRKDESFVTNIPSFGGGGLQPLLDEQGVVVNVRPEKQFSFWNILLSVLPFVFLIWLIFTFFGRMRSQTQNIFSMGRSRVKQYRGHREKTTFDDIAGSKGVKTELKEIIEYLKDPSRYHRLGGRAPRGVLLVGAPGTGKTLLARAVAGEAEVPFFHITGSDFMEMFVGVGASRVRDLFEKAKKQSPSIIFIDELDSIGRHRGAGLGGGHDEREQTLNQLLSEMDGFEPNESVIVMAATNRPDILDPALLRPGRFDRRVSVDLPSLKDRVEVLKIHSRNKPLSREVDLEEFARSVPGFSGADLENMLNEAAFLAARKRKEVIGKKEMEEARDKIIMGIERENLAINEEERKIIAYHEAGHAVVASVVPHADPVHKVTIIPRGSSMGSTHQLPESERYIYPKEYLLDRLSVMLGGRAAEKLAVDSMTSGAENDLKEATRVARRMVLDWGMSERFGEVALGGRRQHVFLGEEIAERREYSDETARLVDEEIKAILDEAFRRAADILRAHREGLERVADALMEKEEISGEEVRKLVERS
jgi:cell division protease FtsH